MWLIWFCYLEQKIRGYFSVTVRIVSCDIKIRDSYNSFVFTQKNNDITKYLPLSIFSPTAVWKWRPTAWFIGSPALVLPAPSLPDTMAHFIASMSWTKPGNVWAGMLTNDSPFLVWSRNLHQFDFTVYSASIFCIYTRTFIRYDAHLQTYCVVEHCRPSSSSTLFSHLLRNLWTYQSEPQWDGGGGVGG